ncbi:MAG: hypothetical protein JWM21_526 [Acidobacteria bacterium]|nr:hypothetical protein [Acidobacteriota bacterium]
MNLSTIVKIALCLTVTPFFLSAKQSVLAQDNVSVGYNCEDALAMLDHAAIEARSNKDTSIILIARLGTGEKVGSLNAKRLGPVTEYLNGKATNPLVSGHGARVKGYGRIEVYLAGKLFFILAYKRNRLMDCGNFE